MKITKTVTLLEEGDFSQNWEFLVDADRKGLQEVIDINAVNMHKGKETYRISVKEALEKIGALDVIVDQYDWSLEYAEHVAGEKEYNEINRD